MVEHQPGISVFAERYRVEAILGRGGMGAVSRATDIQTGATLALKQLTIPVGTNNAERRVALFQREYHILTQLNHPNVVKVFDYGLSQDTPYYTMELLGGRSLRELAPLPWRAACAYLIELCSALSVLHARGFVHRDLTPSNVVITEQSIAKLIDFGAMAPMGPNDAAVGTPPYMAPETLELSSLDGRADIFSLGALGYWALTGRHAFPAPTLASLPEYWERAPPSASHFDPDIPAPLDQLIAEMLNISPQARPAQLAEVTQRLSQVLGRPTPPVEAPQLNAHLVAPKLAGRTAELKLAAAYAARAKAGRGVVLMLTGESGMGRSRLLEAFALDAKLAGCLTLQVQASAAQNSRMSSIQSLFASAVRQAPDRAASAAEPLAAALEDVWPRDSSTEAARVPRISRELQVAVVTFFERLQAMCPLAICVDDLHLADPASLQIFAQLAHASGSSGLFAFSALPPSAAEPATLARLRELAENVPLRELDLADTRDLLSSMFGALPGLDALASWVQRASEGRPQTSIELVTHLVARGAITFQTGRFELVAGFADLELPHSVEEVLQARWSGLSDAARTLVSAMALTTRVCVPRVETLLALVAQQSSDSLAFDALTELLGQRLIKVDHDYCSFANPRFAALVLDQVPTEVRRELSRGLADSFFAQGIDFHGFAAQFYRQAGDLARTQTILAEVDSAKAEDDTPLALLARSPLGQKMYEEILDFCKARGDSPATLFRFRKVMLQLAAVDAPELTRYAPETLEQLRYDVGLDCWDQFADVADPMARLIRCFQVADERYKKTELLQRGLEPGDALKELATCVALLVGAYTPIYETRGMDALPPLIEPLRGLAPVLDVVYLLAKSAADSTVRGCFFLEARQDLVRRLSEPVAGMDPITQNGAYLLSSFYIQLELAIRGSEGGLGTAEELEAAPMYAMLGKQLRLVAALSQGDFDGTRRAREERELLSLQSTFTDQHRETSVRWEALATYRAADVVGLKQLIQAQAGRATRFPGAQPLLHMLRAQYLLLAAEPERSLAEVHAGQALAPPLTHACWRELALLETQALLALDRIAEAGTCADRTEAHLRSVQFDPRYEDRLVAAQARALAAAGSIAAAKTCLEATIRDFEAVGPNGVPIASLYEALAEIALLETDATAFQSALEEVKRIYSRGNHPGLIARYERLVATGRRLLTQWSGAGLVRSDVHERMLTVTQVRSGVGPVRSDEQFRQLLGIVLDEAAAASGYLYHLSSARALRQLAQRGAAPLNPALELKLTEYLEHVLAEETDSVTVTGEAAGGLFVTVDGASYVPIVLRDYEDPTRVLGMIAVGSTKPVEIGRGLLGMLSQTLKVLLSNAR